jgi:diguanylate cyclase (GGDEF)-like protein
MNEEKLKSENLMQVNKTGLALATSTLIGRGLELALQLTAQAEPKQPGVFDRRAVVCINDERLLNLSCAQLTMHGYRTVQVPCPSEMLKLSKRENFHLILTDMDTNALAMAKHIHHEDPTIPALTVKLIDRGVLFQSAPFSISAWDQPLSLLHNKIAPEELKHLTSIGGHRFDIIVWHVWSEQYIDEWSRRVLDDIGESARPYLKAVREEVSKIRRNADQMRTVLQLDALTGVCSRTFFEMRIVLELAQAIRLNRPVSLILACIDSFKSLTDEFGDDMGNDVLRSVSAIFKQQNRKMDIVCRFSDDDFLIIVPETSADTALRVAEKLRRAIETHNFPGISRGITISCGVAEYRTHGLTQDELVHAADTALGFAKSSGRNRAAMAAVRMGHSSTSSL